NKGIFMKHHEQIEIEAAKVVAELFAGNASPMETFGITWSQTQMLERKNPGVVIKLVPDDGKKLAYC
ncbi:hypothetical protein, partial [Escherichia coli]